MKVFLGGSFGNTNWMESLIALIKVDYMKPAISSAAWEEADRLKEVAQRSNSDLSVYVLAPGGGDYYPVAELVDDSNKRPSKTVVCMLETQTGEKGTIYTFTDTAKLSLGSVISLVKGNGVQVFSTLEDLAAYINSKA